MTEELKINMDMYTGSQEEADAIKIAIEKLSTASQEQFEEIKKEKWYNRVFDMVTFSQKGQKRLAEQINTVAQAQQILLELLLRLSSDSTDISCVVAASMNDIRKITEQNIYLLSKINHLENIALGIKSDMDIDKLADKEKLVLCACLYWLSDNYKSASEEQKKFANAVISYLGVDGHMDNPMVAFKDMKNDSKRKILACCMEYIFLEEVSFDLFDKYGEFVEEFDFGGKTIRDLKKQIESLYSLRGCEGFYSKYMTNSYMEIDDSFFFEFDDVIMDVINQDFDEVALANLQAIMEKHGIVKDDLGYRELTEAFFLITPDAYLGKHPSHSVYFTTTGLYVEGPSGSWISMIYSELCPEKIIINTIEKNSRELIVQDTSGDSFRFRGGKEACDDFERLMYELKTANIADDDEYCPIWLEDFYPYEETYLYGEILIDFLKLGQHNTVAALKKCSEFIEKREDDDLFKQICEYAFVEEKVNLEDLKLKVSEWKSTLEPHMVNIHIAILYKDLVEILQLETEESSAMTSVEKIFLDWLASEAGITEIERFKEIVMLPYRIVACEFEDNFSKEIAEIEKYAYQQLFIPYDILDNEKIGFWSSLYRAEKEYRSFIIPSKKRQETLKNLFMYSKLILFLEFVVSIFSFMNRIYSLDDAMIVNQMGIFINNNDFLIQIKELIYECCQKEGWSDMCKKYFEEDRRHMGEEVVEWWIANIND